MLASMHRIMAVSKEMLNEKLKEIDVKDSETKKDIMSLLVRWMEKSSPSDSRNADWDIFQG